jgi:FMN phosphatase YigB (HAD superfamily)
MASKRFDVISWDLDGTLYDMPRLQRRVLLRAALRAWRPRTWRELAALDRLRRAMADVRRRGGALGDAMPVKRARLLRFEQLWYGPALREVGLKPGARAALAEFASAGYRQVLVSDYHPQYKLAALGVEGAFERLFAGEALGHLKPSPELFRIVCRELGVPPARVLHIGDHDDRDGAAARGAGCAAVIVGAQIPPMGTLLARAGG